MNRNATSRTSALRHAFLGLAALGLSASAAQAQTVYGLSITSSPSVSSLVTFNATTPGTLTATVPITGLTAGQTLVGLDVRPNTGQLFALGYNPATTTAQLYILNATTGVLTAVGAATGFALNLGTNTARIGFDFNPSVDRIRVTGSGGTNFRLNPNTGGIAATDTNLAYAATDANAGQTPGIGAVAYANSFIGATLTVLYDIDEANSRYTTQNPPNEGILNSRNALMLPLGTTLATDLDIYFNPTTRANNAYLSVVTSTGGIATASTQLYTLDFLTGAGMTLVGNIGPANTVVTDIAFAISRPATLPAVTGQLAYALGGTNLLTFDTSNPGLIRTATGITGVDAAQTLVGLDIRPATNSLYALGYNATAQTYTLYTLNAQTGAATAVNAAPIALPLGTSKVGFDFNPTVDRIRVTAGNRSNFRLNPVDGTIAATDLQLTYATGDANAAATPNIGASAYTNSVAGSTAATTVLHNYDLSLNILTTQNPPNNGTLNTVGASGITVNGTAPSVDLDIFSSAAGTNTAYLVANTGTTANTSLYTVNLATGTTTLVGAIGNGLAARDIAIAGAAGIPSAVRDRTDLATGVSLYPNPAHASTRLSFTLPHAGRVELSVFDALSRRVDTQAAAVLPAGAQSLTWTTGRVQPGLYFLRLSVDGKATATRQVVVE